ncbi:hypothetical protein Tco_1138260 [Tanacetum coccineum]
MRKESCQHSAVRSFPIFPAPLSQQRNVKIVESASVTRVSRKPTNQPKFNGKRGTPRYAGCHIISTRLLNALAYLASYINYDDRDEYESDYD